MNTKEWLRQCRHIENEIKQLKESKEQAFSLALGSGVDISKDKLSSTKKNVTEDKFAAYAEYSLLLDKKITELLSKRLEIRRLINELDNCKHRMLLQYYYIDCFTWEQVAEKLNNDVRWIHRLHSIALQKIDELRKSH